MKKTDLVSTLLLSSICIFALTSCSGTSTATSAEAGETYTGTVSEISEESMTITTESDGDIAITLSSDTTFTYEMGDMGGTGGGQAPSGDGGSGDSDSDNADASEGTDASAADTEDSSTPPEIPDGDTASDNTEDSGGSGSDNDSSTPPEMPDGDAGGSDSSGTDAGSSGDNTDSSSDNSTDSSSDNSTDSSSAPESGGEAPSGDGSGMEELTYENVSEGDSVTVVIDDSGIAESVSIAMDGAAGAESTADISYTAVNEYTSDTEVNGETIESTGTDESAVLVGTDDITVTMSDVTITRDSDDSTGGDNSSFYGVGASALVTNGTLSVSDSTITSDAAGGAGVFAYGDGTAYVSDTTISTAQDTSGGIHVAGGGTLYAWNLTVDTQGESSAAIRSDRGSGTMVVDGGTYTSNGTSSPAVYSTADISVNDAVLTSTASEAACIEGLNTIRLFDCDLSGSMADSDQNDCTWNVILYQSQSGDSEEGNSTFEMVGGSLTAENGGMFYTTNTESTFVISDVDITYADDSEFLLKCTGNSNERGWGESGANGADCSFTAIAQKLQGDVIWDTISQLDFYLTDDSSLTGALVNDESNAGDGGDGYANVYIDESSTWTVTGDSTLTALYNEGSIVDEEGKAVSIVGTDGTTYVDGSSAYTITVDSYSESAEFSGASSADSWSDYAVEQP